MCNACSVKIAPFITTHANIEVFFLPRCTWVLRFHVLRKMLTTVCVCKKGYTYVCKNVEGDLPCTQCYWRSRATISLHLTILNVKPLNIKRMCAYKIFFCKCESIFVMLEIHLTSWDTLDCMTVTIKWLSLKKTFLRFCLSVRW